MQKPTLVVMAAGMGSRYGGLKQIDPIGKHGEIIMDYSLFDAMQAGFEKVVFIINRRIEQDFYEVIGHDLGHVMDIAGGGLAEFVINLPLPEAYMYYTAIAWGPSNGQSEFSACKASSTYLPTIFR